MEERLQWLFLGCVIGFILGYTVRALREMGKLPPRQPKNEDGFMRYPVVQDIAIVTALLLTVFAAFSAAHTNNQVKRVVECNKIYLEKSLAADTTRNNYLKRRQEANAELQEANGKFIRSLLSAPPDQGVEAAKTYLKALDHFLEVSGQEEALSPYPTVQDLQDCFED